MLSPGKILVVDDSSTNRKVLHIHLVKLGFEVIEAVNGLEALEVMSNDLPDLVLLDVMMPVMNGLDCCRQIKAGSDTRHIPVFFITSLNDRDSMLKGIEAGADDFIHRPIDIGYIKLRIQNAINAKRLRDRVVDQLEQLQQLESSRDGLVHMLVHDMRSPLQTIQGFSDIALTEQSISNDLQTWLQLINSESKRMVGMVSDILDVSRMENSEMPLDLKPVAIVDLIENLVGKYPKSANRAELKFHSQNVHHSTHIQCDESVIGRVLENFIGNAVKYTPANGEVEISVLACERVPQRIRIQVADQGPGIPEDQQDRIFQKFEQVVNSETHLPQKYSSGLGLAFCKMAIEAHHGEIGLDSEPGKGAVFWIDFDTEMHLVLAS